MSRGAGQPKSGRVLLDICGLCGKPWRECKGTCPRVDMPERHDPTEVPPDATDLLRRG